MRNLRRMIRWCFYLLPPWYYLLLGLIVMGIVEAMAYYLAKRRNIPASSFFMPVRLIIAGYLGFFYGCYRATKFHPWFQPLYRQWLASTPWQPGKSLPLGPIHLLIQDVIYLTLVYLYISSSPYALPVDVLSFLVPYLIILAFSFFCTGNWPYGYAIAFGLATTALFGERWEAMVLMALGCYGIALRGINAMLWRFPWEETWESAMIGLHFTSGKKQPVNNTLGWHFERLTPQAKIYSIPQRHRLLFPLLAGWICYVATINAHDIETKKACFSIFYLIPSTVFFMARLGFYCYYYHPSMGILGRIYSGQLIILRFDKVYLVPLGLLLFAVAIPLALWQLGLPLAPVLAVSLTLVLFLAMNGKPSLKNWALTGGHRIAAMPRRMVKLRG